MITYEITVKGLVQGVGFRYFAVRNASKLGITGYVKNMPNGDVFIIAQGLMGQMDDFVKLMRIGPAMAEVHDFTIQECQPMQFTSFRIK